MVVISSGTYEHFKTVFSALDGGKKTTVLFIDNGSFVMWAILANEASISTFNAPTKPTTFDADFPRAIQVDSLSYGG